MGEVRARVKLTNAVDEALARRGTFPESQVHTYEADALVDTGAVRSVLPVQVVQQLDMDGTGRRLVPNPAHLDQPVTKVK
ncbi:MAG: hypothetical protein HY321_11700 [Armatimonadetes bacterium]|nr:hypothetical protein [Armatimonadota bacterium]